MVWILKEKYLNIFFSINVSHEWFIGFVEGEGIKTGSSIYLQVAQKDTSLDCINVIIAFF